MINYLKYIKIFLKDINFFDNSINIENILYFLNFIKRLYLFEIDEIMRVDIFHFGS
jgi:hypothetical protein